MDSSLFTAAKLRLLDRATRAAHRPNRIDARADVSALAEIRASDLHGPVRVAAHARLYRTHVFGPVTIGANSSLWGPRIYIDARPEPIVIGNFCSIARDVSFHGYGHDMRRISTYYIGRNVLGLPIEDEIVSGGAITIGHDVWIGAGVQILAGVTIGTGAVIGAGSIVSRDIPPYAVAVGSPAAVVKARFSDDLVEDLLVSKWWEWSHDQIRERQALFTQPLTRALLDKYA
jgi:virginiamycin A acetyltransferase